MRTIKADLITKHVSEMCVQANTVLPEDVRHCLLKSHEMESWGTAKNTLARLIENYKIAQEEAMPICQDTGVTCVFVELGQNLHVEGDISEAINEGVRIGSIEGFLRASLVSDPLNRVNTKDNTPAMIYFDIVPGDKLKLTVAPKGFGSENMSKISMLKPSDGLEGVKAFVLKTVEEAGPNPCPPIIVGVGIGGTFDKAALMAKKALMRPTDDVNPNLFYAELECELLDEINKLGIGPQGFGGKTTALAVKINTMATHIAGLPVALNINCHVARHVEVYL
jgi:fumarate hydratase subunit alpha